MRALLTLPLMRPLQAGAQARNTEPFTLDTLMARLAAAPERRVSFTERRTLAAIDTPLISSGTLLHRPGYLEKTTTFPIPERLQIEADRLVLTAGNDPPRVIPLDSAPELRTLIDAIRAPLQGDTATLRRAFEPTLTGTADGWSLTLIPRETGAAAMVRIVSIRGRGDQVSELAVTQANGDEQQLTIKP